MGQYYRPVFLKGNPSSRPEFAFSSYDYENGAKLMEHSYIYNYLCLAVEHHMLDKPRRLVWAGDYADPISFRNLKDLNRYDLSYPEVSTLDGKILKTGCTVIKPDTHHSYDEMKAELRGIYVINHTKKVFFKMPDKEDFVINPLPILTSEGNGRGLGDFRGQNQDLAGKWAGDLIETSHDIPEKYKEMESPEFIED